MKTVLIAVLMIFGISSASFGDEHPKEHPKDEKGEKKENPAKGEGEKHEHPAKKSGEQKKKDKKKTDQPPTSWNKMDVEKDLVTFINDSKAKSEGLFVVKDEIGKMDRQLTLEKIHSDKIVPLPEGVSFVCADFKDANGDKVDVDFFMTPTSEGKVASVDRIQVHKVNGNARYNYVKKNGKWVQVATN